LDVYFVQNFTIVALNSNLKISPHIKCITTLLFQILILENSSSLKNT